jgi:hypothetical protein
LRARPANIRDKSSRFRIGMRACAARCALSVTLFGLDVAGNIKSPAGQACEVLPER